MEPRREFMSVASLTCDSTGVGMADGPRVHVVRKRLILAGRRDFIETETSTQFEFAIRG